MMERDFSKGWRDRKQGNGFKTDRKQGWIGDEENILSRAREAGAGP